MPAVIDCICHQKSNKICKVQPNNGLQSWVCGGDRHAAISKLLWTLVEFLLQELQLLDQNMVAAERRNQIMSQVQLYHLLQCL